MWVVLGGRAVSEPAIPDGCQQLGGMGPGMREDTGGRAVREPPLRRRRLFIRLGGFVLFCGGNEGWISGRRGDGVFHGGMVAGEREFGQWEVGSGGGERGNEGPACARTTGGKWTGVRFFDSASLRSEWSADCLFGVGFVLFCGGNEGWISRRRGDGVFHGRNG